MESLKGIRNRSIPRTTPRLVNILGINKANLQSKVSKEGAYVKECMHAKRMGGLQQHRSVKQWIRRKVKREVRWSNNYFN